MAKRRDGGGIDGGHRTRRFERCDGAEIKVTPLFNLCREDYSETGVACGMQKAFSARIKRYFEHDANHGRPLYRNVRRRTASAAIRMVVNNAEGKQLENANL
jgi:hypothetical protein